MARLAPIQDHSVAPAALSQVNPPVGGAGGTPKPFDPFGLANPPAWPEVDETALGGCAQAFAEAAVDVLTQAGSLEGVRAYLFQGNPPWSGGEELSRPVDRGVSGDLRSGLLIAV